MIPEEVREVVVVSDESSQDSECVVTGESGGGPTEVTVIESSQEDSDVDVIAERLSQPF